MALIVLGPLLHVNISSLPEYLSLPSIGQERTGADAEAVYQQIMRELIEDQTEALLRDQAEALGASVEFRVVSSKDEASEQFVPWSVEIIGALTPEQQAVLRSYLTNALNIPAERQRWSIS